jgi:Spy/CpxP family protein refolding chaperone
MSRPLHLRSSWFVVALTLGLLTSATGVVMTQGRRGGRGGGEPGAGGPDVRSRMELFTDALLLTGTQKDAVKDRLDAAHKVAAPIRDDLETSRTALAAAAAKAGGSSDITKAAEAYAGAATAMTELEMKTLADILSVVTPEQKKQGTAAAFYLMRGIFLDEKKWNEMPKGRLY